MAEFNEDFGDQDLIDRGLPSGNCWHCGKFKKNMFGLCSNCGRFGKSLNEIERQKEEMEKDFNHSSNYPQRPVPPPQPGDFDHPVCGHDPRFDD